MEAEIRSGNNLLAILAMIVPPCSIVIIIPLLAKIKIENEWVVWFVIFSILILLILAVLKLVKMCFPKIKLTLKETYLVIEHLEPYLIGPHTLEIHYQDIKLLSRSSDLSTYLGNGLIRFKIKSSARRFQFSAASYNEKDQEAFLNILEEFIEKIKLVGNEIP